MLPRLHSCTLFPYPTLFRSDQFREKMQEAVKQFSEDTRFDESVWKAFAAGLYYVAGDIGDSALYERMAAKLSEIEQERHTGRSEEHTSELQSLRHLVCRLLL